MTKQMKKTIFIAVLAVIFCAPITTRAEAVDLTAESRAALILEIQTQIQALLLQLVQQLQAELAKQVTSINSVSAKVDTVIQNQLGSVSSSVTPAPIPSPIPVDISTLDKATFGTVFKSSDPFVSSHTDGVERNIFPIIFNDAYEVYVFTNCSNYGPHDTPNGGFRLIASENPNGDTFKRNDFGVCKFTLTSYTQDKRVIGSDELTFDTDL